MTMEFTHLEVAVEMCNERGNSEAGSFDIIRLERSGEMTRIDSICVDVSAAASGLV